MKVTTIEMCCKTFFTVNEYSYSNCGDNYHEIQMDRNTSLGDFRRHEVSVSDVFHNSISGEKMKTDNLINSANMHTKFP